MQRLRCSASAEAELASHADGEPKQQLEAVLDDGVGAHLDVKDGQEGPRAAAEPTLGRGASDKDIFDIMTPAALTFSLDPLLGAADTAIAGRLGATALGAVGLSSLVMNFTMMCFRFLMIVTVPAVAAAAAVNNWQKVSQETSDGLWVALVCGLVSGGLLYYYAPHIMASMKAGAELVPMATEYLRVRCWAAPVATALLVVQATFRGLKDTRTPLYSSLLSNAVNLSLDVILVFGCGMGVAGAAWATNASQYIALLFLGGTLIARRMLSAGELLRPPAWSRVAPLANAGVLLTAERILSTVLLLQSAVFAARMGPVPLAAHEVARQVFGLQYILFAALELTSTSLIASQVGRQDSVGAGLTLRRLMTISLRAGLVVSGVCMVAAFTVPQIFTSDPAVISLARRAIPIIALGSPLDAVAAAMDGGLLGAADYRWVSTQMTVASVISYGIIQALLANGGGLVELWLGLRTISLVRVVGGWWRLSAREFRVLPRKHELRVRFAA